MKVKPRSSLNPTIVDWGRSDTCDIDCPTLQTGMHHYFTAEIQLWYPLFCTYSISPFWRNIEFNIIMNIW